MSQVRRALHVCADLLADAFEAEAHERDETSVPVKKSRRTRGPARAPIPQVEVSPEVRATVEANMRRQGLI